MVSRIGAAFVVAALGLATPSASAAPAANKGAPAPAPGAAKAPAADGRGVSPTPVPPISQDAAARARMHECAHQWSAIKKAGNAGATTWKEFSATCLVVSR